MKSFTLLLALLLVVLVGSGMVGCEDEGNSVDEPDGSTDTDTETDTGTDTGPCEVTAQWGGGVFSNGSNVANFNIGGLFDGDGDDVVDDEEAPFTLEDIFCAGYQSVIFAVSDANCPPCGIRYGALAATSFFDDITAQNSVMLMFYSGGLGAQTRTAQENYEYFSEEYGFDPGYYSGVSANTLIPLTYYPTMAVVDLNTGIILRVDYYAGDGDQMTGAEIIQLATDANLGE